MIGHGALDKRVEQIARGFEMDITIGERRGDRSRAGRLPLDEVIARSDVLVVLCPLTEETRGLMGSRELSTMKPDSLLINCARGGIVDEPALLDAIPRGVIAGAGVDVLSGEPPTSGNVLLEAELPNPIETPRVAWISRESQQILADQLVDNIEAWQAGSAQNVVLRWSERRREVRRGMHRGNPICVNEYTETVRRSDRRSSCIRHRARVINMRCLSASGSTWIYAGVD